MLFYIREESEEDREMVFLIGRIELAKRSRGISEKDLYELQLSLKSPQDRKEYAKEEGESLLELERLYNDLKFRRKLYRNLRRESKERKQEEEVSQKDKENSDEDVESGQESG